jgi:hypothetical protein
MDLNKEYHEIKEVISWFYTNYNSVFLIDNAEEIIKKTSVQSHFLELNLISCF